MRNFAGDKLGLDRLCRRPMIPRQETIVEALLLHVSLRGPSIFTSILQLPRRLMFKVIAQDGHMALQRIDVYSGGDTGRTNRQTAGPLLYPTPSDISGHGLSKNIVAWMMKPETFW